MADAEVVHSSCEDVAADRGDSSNKDSGAEVELAAPALMPILSFSTKVVGLAWAYEDLVVDRDPNHILAAVADEDIHVEEDKREDEAERQPSFCYLFCSRSGIKRAIYWPCLVAR